MDPYKEQFFSSIDGEARAAVKRLTRTIENELVETSINAPDWDTLYAARMARDLLWETERSIKLDDFVVVSQTLVDLFSNVEVTPDFKVVRQHLLRYYSLLQSSHLTNAVLHSLPLPRSLDPNTPATVPSRLYTLLLFIRDSAAALILLPFCFVPLIVHTPVYIMGRIGAKLVESEEETQAQNKLAFGLISLLLIYPALFFFLWGLFWYTNLGALLSAFMVYLFAVYHNKIIDGNYERAKRFVAAWRVLVGIWTPRRWDLSLTALSQYTTPPQPPASPWIDKPRKPNNASDTDGKIESKYQDRVVVESRPPRRPPSHRLVRHVLRSRVEAMNALACFFDQLGRAGSGKKVKSSPHLAERFGVKSKVSLSADTDEHEGWRYAVEVITFLQKRGARIPTLRQGPLEDDWALSSDCEGDSED